jgi:hypothetical protein
MPTPFTSFPISTRTLDIDLLETFVEVAENVELINEAVVASENSATVASAAASSAITSASTATTQADSATASASSASTDAATATTQADSALSSATLAQQWASNPEDDTVPGGGGLFSSLHYAAKAAEERALAQAWAEGTEPGGPGTKSSLEHAEDAENSKLSAAASAAAAGVASGRLEAATFTAMQTKFVYSAPGAGQEAVATNDLIRVVDGGYTYRVAASGASDQNLTTSGGVKLYAVVNDAPIYARQFHSFDLTGATDELANLQGAINFARANGKRHLILPAGTLLINGTIVIGDTGSGFHQLRISGANGSFIGTTMLRHAPGQLMNPLINLVGLRSFLLEDVRLSGNNAAPEAINSGSHRSTNLADYASAGISTGRYNPYAGITFSALRGTDPGGGGGYTFAAYGQLGLASKCFFERVRIDKFYAGVVVGPNALATGLEDFMFRDCSFIENAYGVCTTSTQQRNVVVENSNAQGSYALFDEVTFGDQLGTPIVVKNSILAKAAFTRQSATAVGNGMMRDCYLESVRSLGVIGTGPNSARIREVYDACHLSLIGHDENGTQTQKDTPIFNHKPLFIANGSMVTRNLLVLNPQQRITFSEMDFRVESSTSQTVWGVWPNQGAEHLVYLEGCEMRAYSGPTRYINNVQEVASLPTRARVEWNCQEIVDRSTGRRWRVVRHPVSFRGPSISALTYDSLDALSFDFTTAADRPIQVGDLVYWRVFSPIANNASGATSILPALRVTAISGARVTCEILAHIDTSFSPTQVDVAVFNFVNGTIATGNTTSGSADITGVTNISNFAVGDWIVTNDGVLAPHVRITAISGTTITCHRTLGVTNTGIQIWNAKLLPHGVKADAFTTYDPPSLADGEGTTTTVKCRGAALGDAVIASFNVARQGITVTAEVSAADVVSVRFQNETGGILDLASGTLAVTVFE